MIQSAERDPAATGSGEDIAIVGMACLFPGADTIDGFWRNIVSKTDCITDAPPDWQPELFYGPEGPEFDKSYVQRGGFVGDLCRFNPVKYGVPPSAIEGAEPDHFIALRCAYEAMADAGYPEVPLNRDKTGVIVGRGIFVNRGWVAVFQRLFAVDQVLSVLRMIEPHRSDEELDFIRDELKRRLPPANADTFPGLVHSALVGRIANRLDLNGPAYTLDAACASVSLCLEHAVRELRSGRCDAVLVGGSQVSLPAPVHIMFCHLDALSHQGLIAPFSKQAAGTVLGQGCGMVVVKRRSDAERDGNRIYAVVKGVSSSSDGKGAGILTPKSEGQQLSIRRAYEETGLSPDTVELIEAHGTGIAMGDATEIETLNACFGPPDENGPTIAIGSVKSMIGHLIPASGAASLIKTALAVYHRTLPPTLHSEENNPDLDLPNTRFYTCNETRPWLHCDDATPRRAGMNAFGFGGINAHVILEEYAPASGVAQSSLEWEWPCELVVVSAENRDGLIARVDALAEWCDRAEGVRLLDIAATAAEETGPCRVAVVAADRQDLVRKLRKVSSRLAEPDRVRIQDRGGVFWYDEPLAREGRVAFLFPGEGSQYVHMHSDLCRHFPDIAREFELTGMAMEQRGGQIPFGRILFPQPRDEAAADVALLQMDVAVAAVTASARGMLGLLQQMNVAAEGVVGHSSGEFAAVLASGAFRPTSEEELIQSIVAGMESTARVSSSDLIEEAVLVAVGGTDPGAVEEAVEASGGRVVVAMDNCPYQVVLVGDEESMDQAMESLNDKGGVCQRIPWNRPYHTDACAPICRFVEEYVEQIQIQDPDLELWSCATAEPFPPGADAIKELVARQWRSRVRFRETIDAMYDAGYRVFVEVGPRSNLSAFVSQTLDERAHAAIPIDSHLRSGLEQLCRAAGMMAAHGLDIDLTPLFRRREPELLDFTVDPPAPPKPDPILRLDLPVFEMEDEALDKARSMFAPAPGPAPTAGGDPGAPPPASPAGGARGGSRGANARAAAMGDFQRTMQHFLKIQQSVMTSAKSARPGPTSAEAPPSGIGSASGAAAAADEPEPSGVATMEPVETPMLSRVLEHAPGDRLVAEADFDLRTDRFLLDHTFFGQTVSTGDPSLHALPVMPLVMMLELLSEAAARLRDDMRVVAVSDIEISGWVSFETPERSLRVAAEAEGPDRVRATLHDVDYQGVESPVIATAVIECAAEFPQLSGTAVEDVAADPPPWSSDEIYRKILYHGPAFRGVEHVEAWSQEGIRTVLRTPDPGLLFADGARPLVLPVQLVDAASQIPAMVYTNWKLEGPICRCAFPNTIRRLEFVQPVPDGAELIGVARYHREGTSLVSDVEIQTRGGDPVLRYLGRVEEGVDFPLSLYRYAFEPLENRCGAELSQLFRDVPGIEQSRIVGLLGGEHQLFAHRLWSEVLARTVLSAEELVERGRTALPPADAGGRLLSRTAAKEAVRMFGDYTCCLADIRITTADAARPAAQLADGPGPQISLAHAGCAAVAVAAGRSVGIDLALIRTMSPAHVDEAFTIEEVECISAAADDGALASLLWQAWCAKAAAGRALGRDIAAERLAARIVEIDANSGRFKVDLQDASGIDVYTRVHEGYALALCVAAGEASS